MVINYKKIKAPLLKDVNGLLNLGVLAFGWFNLVLGCALFSQTASTDDFFIISGIFSYQFWGLMFFVGGLSLLTGHLINWWSMMRHTVLFLLFTKFMWLAALLARQADDPGSNLFLLLFFSLATVLQVGGYIYFPIYKKVETWKQ